MPCHTSRGAGGGGGALPTGASKVSPDLARPAGGFWSLAAGAFQTDGRLAQSWLDEATEAGEVLRAAHTVTPCPRAWGRATWQGHAEPWAPRGATSSWERGQLHTLDPFPPKHLSSPQLTKGRPAAWGPGRRSEPVAELSLK